MEIIKNELLKETKYTEKLDNGLEIIIFHKPMFNISSCALGINVGSLNIHQRFNNKEYHFNPGIAHFLEHKIFEDQNNDVLNAFMKLKADVNAFTSDNATIYYFSKTNNDIDDALNLLINFVFKLDISEESISKEKDIIIKEIGMYKENINNRIMLEIFNNLYHHFPLKYDIGGNKESVYNITKKELELFYELNYRTSNMKLVITTPLDPLHLIDVIKNNPNMKKEYTNIPTTFFLHEPIDVVNKKKNIILDLKEHKHAIAYKSNLLFKDNYEAIFYDWCIKIFLEAQFSSINPLYQKWLDKKMINGYFGYHVEINIDYAYMFFYIENEKNYLNEIIEEALANIILDEEILKHIKRRFLGGCYELMDEIEAFNLSYLKDILNDLDYFKIMDIIKNITLDDIFKVWKSLDFSKKTILSFIKK